MTELRKVRISEICKLNSQSILQSDNYDFIKYLDTGSITKNVIYSTQTLKPSKDKIPSRAKRKIKKETIIYSTVRPNQEHYGYFLNPLENLIVSTGFTTIDVIDPEVNSKYIYYQLTQKHITKYLHTIAENSVSSYPSINSSDIGNLSFLIPKQKNKQEKIADVITVIDKKIELNHQINTELEAMAKTLYDYWFIQFDFPDANGKPYKSSGGKMVYNATLKRETPQGWHDKTVICPFINIGNSQSRRDISCWFSRLRLKIILL